MRRSGLRYRQGPILVLADLAVGSARKDCGHAHSVTAKLRQQQVPPACLHGGSARTARLLVVVPAASKSWRDEGGMPSTRAAQARVARTPTVLRLQLRLHALLSASICCSTVWHA